MQIGGGQQPYLYSSVIVPVASEKKAAAQQSGDQKVPANEKVPPNQDKSNHKTDKEKSDQQRSASSDDSKSKKDKSSNSNSSSNTGVEFTADELKLIEKLSKRDQEVRTHEQAHAAVGGVHAGAPKYQYERGPDGAQYAISGEVPIDIAPVAGDPEKSLEKMLQVQRAALAPAEPSSQDRKVAAKASQQASQARAEILLRDREEAKQQQEELKAKRESSDTSNSSDSSNSSGSSDSGIATEKADKPHYRGVQAQGIIEGINKAASEFQSTISGTTSTSTIENFHRIIQPFFLLISFASFINPSYLPSIFAQCSTSLFLFVSFHWIFVRSQPLIPQLAMLM